MSKKDLIYQNLSDIQTALEVFNGREAARGPQGMTANQLRAQEAAEEKAVKKIVSCGLVLLGVTIEALTSIAESQRGFLQHKTTGIVPPNIRD